MPAYIDFKELAAAIDVADVAQHARVKLKQSGSELRGACPACNSGDERALQVIPQTNSFRCHSAKLSGDCISLYAHVANIGNYAAARALQEHFLGARTAPPTPPQKTEVRKQPPPPKSEAFDPEAFAQKLTYTEQVEELGIREADAERLSIGYCTKGLMKGRVCFPVRNADGTIAGFVGFGDGTLKLPQKWQSPTVVPFKQRAS